MPSPTTSIDTHLHIVALHQTSDYSYRAIGRLLNIAPTAVSIMERILCAVVPAKNTTKIV